MIAAVDIPQQGDDAAPVSDCSVCHRGESSGKAREGERRSQLEHLANLEQFACEALGEALEHPAGVRPLLDEAEALEAVEELADAPSWPRRSGGRAPVR
jgi:hypothetical protein